MTPLRQSIEDLNTTVMNLPSDLSSAVESGMQRSFSSKLNELFDAQTFLATEASMAVRALSSYASTLNESGQDFLEAAQAFRQSDFASTLADSVKDLLETREQLSVTTESLNNRLFDVRDSLMSTQSQWKLLAKVAEQELEASRLARETIQQEVQSLQLATTSLEQTSLVTTESTKQLREARLEVMRDRKLAIEVAEAIQQRLSTDNAAVESCQVFAATLDSVLSNWNANVARLNDLTTSFMDALKNAKNEDEQRLAERGRQLTALIEQLRSDLNLNVGAQREAIESLGMPTANAQAAAQSLLLQF
jgi:SMC interacting uncharacterized protein involved in chromosome segregation